MLALTMRLVLFAVFQALIGVQLSAAGVASPWPASAAWWPCSAVATSIVTFVFLTWRARVEAFSMTSYFRPTRPGVWTDILLTLTVTVVGGTLAVGGTIALAPVFFADPQTASALLIQPLPLWAAVLAVVLFPITIALTELPLYFGYAQPRVAGLTRSAWATVLVPAVALSLQHATLPLIFDPAFLAWRALMFLGFALVLSWALWKRPRLLPYLIVVHSCSTSRLRCRSSSSPGAEPAQRPQGPQRGAMSNITCRTLVTGSSDDRAVSLRTRWISPTVSSTRGADPDHEPEQGRRPERHRVDVLAPGLDEGVPNVASGWMYSAGARTVSGGMGLLLLREHS